MYHGEDFFPLIWEAVTNKLQLEVLNVKTVWTCSQANTLRSFCQQKKINLQLQLIFNMLIIFILS